MNGVSLILLATGLSTLSLILIYVLYIVILVFLAFGFKYQSKSTNQAIDDFFKYMKKGHKRVASLSNPR